MRLVVVSWLSVLMRLLVMLWLCVVVAACDASPEQQRRDVSTSFCQCEGALTPVLLDQCIAEVLPFVDAAPSEECMDCVYLNSQMCSDLSDDCAQLCLNFTQP